MEISEFKYSMWDNTRKISERMNMLLNVMGAKHELSALQLRILMEIYQNEKHTVGSLASSLMIAGTNLSAMCKKLESLGYLLRSRDRKDERVVFILLTEKGKNLITEIDGMLEGLILRAAEADSKLAEDFSLITKAMEKLNELLSKLNDQEDGVS